MLRRNQRTNSAPPIAITNVLLSSLILLFACVAVYARFYYRPSINPDYAREVADAVGRRIEANAPRVQEELVELGNEAWPIIQTALVHRARNDYPMYARALEQEGTEYFNNVERAFIAKVKARYHEYLYRHREILTSEFPEHATRENVEQILAAFEATFDELVDRYYIDQFRYEAARTEELWAAIPPARQPDADEPSLEKQLGETSREWMITLLRTPVGPPPSSRDMVTTEPLPHEASQDATDSDSSGDLDGYVDDDLGETSLPGPPDP